MFTRGGSVTNTDRLVHEDCVETTLVLLIILLQQNDTLHDPIRCHACAGWRSAPLATGIMSLRRW